MVSIPGGRADLVSAPNHGAAVVSKPYEEHGAGVLSKRQEDVFAWGSVRVGWVGGSICRCVCRVEYWPGLAEPPQRCYWIWRPEYGSIEVVKAICRSADDPGLPWLDWDLAAVICQRLARFMAGLEAAEEAEAEAEGDRATGRGRDGERGSWVLPAVLAGVVWVEWLLWFA